VEGIQACIDYSVNKDLVKFENSINLRNWEIVPYDDIPKQKDRYSSFLCILMVRCCYLIMFMFCCSISCGAFVVQYILAWDGEKMAHDFTNVSLKVIVYS
jgi:hypothetical protein